MNVITARFAQHCSYFWSLSAACFVQDTDCRFSLDSGLPNIASAASEWQIYLGLATEKIYLMTSSHLLAHSRGQATKAGCNSEGSHHPASSLWVVCIDALLADVVETCQYRMTNILKIHIYQIWVFTCITLWYFSVKKNDNFILI